MRIMAKKSPSTASVDTNASRKILVTEFVSVRTSSALLRCRCNRYGAVEVHEHETLDDLRLLLERQGSDPAAHEHGRHALHQVGTEHQPGQEQRGVGSAWDRRRGRRPSSPYRRWN